VVRAETERLVIRVPEETARVKKIVASLKL
jgi:hypothetical protein